LKGEKNSELPERASAKRHLKRRSSLHSDSQPAKSPGPADDPILKIQKEFPAVKIDPAHILNYNLKCGQLNSVRKDLL